MSREQQILSMLRQSRQKSFTPKQIAEALGINYETVKRTLLRMYRKKTVFKSCRGNYHLFERDRKGQTKGTTPDNKFTEEKVTKGSIERDKRDRERDKKQVFPPDLVPLIKEYKDMTISVSYAFYAHLWSLKLRTGKNLGELVEDAGIPHYNFHIPQKYLEEMRKKCHGI